MAAPRSASTRSGGRAAAPQSTGDVETSLTRAQRLELYYWMRLTRSLEERLVNLYRQTKVVGGLFRSLGQEADSVGSAYALRDGDILAPLIRNLGSMLVKGATRGFIGQISRLGDMVPVMAGVTLTFKMRGEARVGLVYVGDGATSTGAFHEGMNLAAVQRCPLVVIIENNGYAYSTPTSRQTAATRLVDKAIGYGVPGERADGNDVIATYEATKHRARRGEGASIVELMTYRRKGHAEHDNQSYVPEGEGECWGRENDPIDRYVARLGAEGVTSAELSEIDARVQREIDVATDAAEASGAPEPLDALVGVYAVPAVEKPLWFPRGKGSCRRSERAAAGLGHVRRAHHAERLMAEITYLEAIREALFEEMERDPNVFVIGEDIGAYGGAFKVTDGLLAQFGESRVIDSPISEIGIVGAAAGAAHMGMRPVVEMQFIDFIARLKVVYPSTAEDAKGLMKAAIRDDDCVLFFEHKYLYRRVKGEMPAGDHVVPIGTARVAREGADLSITTYAATVHKALEAAEQLEREDGLRVEVLDLRSLAPLDDEAIMATVKKTNRVLIVHEDARTGGIAGEITARISESCFEWLDASILRVTAHDVPLPYAPSLEDFVLPQVADIVVAARRLAAY